MKQKYVIVEEHGMRVAILFNPIINHSTFEHLKPTSAGFFTLDKLDNVVAFGNSVSLDISADEESDASIINRMLNSARVGE